MNAGTRRLFTQLVVTTITVALSAAVPVVSADGLEAGPPLDSGQIVARMVARNQERARALEGYRSRRHYHLDYNGLLGSRQADMVVDVLYHSPNEKEFSVVSESGSKWICRHVLQRLMQVEQENARPEARQRTEINPENYDFRLLRVETGADGTPFYVLQAEPRTESPYLFRGTVWVEGRDFAVARIEGEPAKNPSRWTKQSDFKHEYLCLDGFWLPAKNVTLTQLHLLGHSHLTIEYKDYQVMRAEGASANPASSSLLRGERELRQGARGEWVERSEREELR
jgi:hypothetical protein